MSTAEILRFPSPRQEEELKHPRSTSRGLNEQQEINITENWGDLIENQGHPQPQSINLEQRQSPSQTHNSKHLNNSTQYEEPAYFSESFNQGQQKQNSSYDKPAEKVSNISLSDALNAPALDLTVDHQLIAAGVAFIRKTPYHIKAGKINFYPSSGKITVDGVGLVKERGIEVFVEACLKIQKGLI